MVAPLGVADPVGCPPLEGHAPPLNAVDVYERDATDGLAVRFAQPPVVTVAARVVHVFAVAFEYTETVAEHAPPLALPQLQLVQPRVSVMPE